MQATFAKVARRFSRYLKFNAPLSNRFVNKLSLADYRSISDTVPREWIPNRAHLLSGRIHFTSRRLCGTAVAMSDTGEWREFLNQEDARELDNCLFYEYKFPVSQCLELAGLSVAQAVARCYPPQDLGVESPKVLICCGPGNNGGDGLVAAKHLFFFVRLSMCLWRGYFGRRVKGSLIPRPHFCAPAGKWVWSTAYSSFVQMHRNIGVLFSN